MKNNDENLKKDLSLDERRMNVRGRLRGRGRVRKLPVGVLWRDVEAARGAKEERRELYRPPETERGAKEERRELYRPPEMERGAKDERRELYRPPETERGAKDERRELYRPPETERGAKDERRELYRPPETERGAKDERRELYRPPETERGAKEERRELYRPLETEKVVTKKIESAREAPCCEVALLRECLEHRKESCKLQVSEMSSDRDKDSFNSVEMRIKHENTFGSKEIISRPFIETREPSKSFKTDRLAYMIEKPSENIEIFKKDLIGDETLLNKKKSLRLKMNYSNVYIPRSDIDTEKIQSEVSNSDVINENNSVAKIERYITADLTEKLSNKCDQDMCRSSHENIEVKAEVYSLLHFEKERSREKLAIYNSDEKLKNVGKNWWKEVNQLSENDKIELKGSYHCESSNMKFENKTPKLKKRHSDEDCAQGMYDNKRSRCSESKDYNSFQRIDKRSMNILKDQHTSIYRMDGNIDSHNIFKLQIDDSFRKRNVNERKDIHKSSITKNIRMISKNERNYSKKHVIDSEVNVYKFDRINRKQLNDRLYRNHDKDFIECNDKSKQRLINEIRRRERVEGYDSDSFETHRSQWNEKEVKRHIRSQVTLFKRCDNNNSNDDGNQYQGMRGDYSRRYEKINDRKRNEEYRSEYISRRNESSPKKYSRRLTPKFLKYKVKTDEDSIRMDYLGNVSTRRKDDLKRYDHLKNEPRSERNRKIKSEVMKDNYNKIESRRKYNTQKTSEDKIKYDDIYENEFESKHWVKNKYSLKDDINKDVEEWTKRSEDVVNEKTCMKYDSFKEEKNILESERNGIKYKSKTNKVKDFQDQIDNNENVIIRKEKGDIIIKDNTNNKIETLRESVSKDTPFSYCSPRIYTAAIKSAEYTNKQNYSDYDLRRTSKSSYSNSIISTTRHRIKRTLTNRKVSRNKRIVRDSSIKLGDDRHNSTNYKRYCSSSRKSSFASSTSNSDSSYDSLNIDLPLISPRSPDVSLKRLSLKEPAVVSANLYLKQLKDTLEKINVAYKSVVSQIPDQKVPSGVPLIDIPLPIEDSPHAQNATATNVKTDNLVPTVHKARHRVHSNSINVDKLSTITNSTICSKNLTSPLFSFKISNYHKELEKTDLKSRPILPKLTTLHIDYSGIDLNLFGYCSTDFFLNKIRCHCVMPNPDQWNDEDMRSCGRGQRCVLRLLNIECSTQRCPTEALCMNCNFQKMESSHLRSNNVEFFFDINESLSWKLRTRSAAQKGVLLFEVGGKASLINKEEELSTNEFDLLLNSMIKIPLKSDKCSLIYYVRRGSREEANVHIERWLVNGRVRLGVYAMEDLAAERELVIFNDKDKFTEPHNITPMEGTDQVLVILHSFIYEPATKHKLLSFLDLLLTELDSSSMFQSFLELGGVPLLFTFSLQYLSENCFDETLFDKLIDLLVKVPYGKSSCEVSLLGMEKQDFIDQLISIVPFLGSHNHQSFIGLERVKKKIFEESNNSIVNDKRQSLRSDSNNLYTLNCRLPNFWCSRECLCDGEARVFFYHKVTLHVQWEMPVYPWESNKDDQADVYDYNSASEVPVTHEEIYDMYLNLNKMYEIKQRRIVNKEVKLRPAKELSATQKKEAFKKKMTEFIVRLLKPYRNGNCKEGRITSDDDLRYLANKLSQTILLKELKILNNSCESLEVTTAVENKTRGYVRMYLASRGSTYQRPQPSHTVKTEEMETMKT